MGVEIYLSVDNNSKVLQMPIPPETYSVSSPFDSEEFVGIQGVFRLAGTRGLKDISFSSFFPSRFYPFSQNKYTLGREYADEIEAMRDTKTPVRLVIASSGPELGINDLFFIDRFDYGAERNGDITYSIGFKQIDAGV